MDRAILKKSKDLFNITINVYPSKFTYSVIFSNRHRVDVNDLLGDGLIPSVFLLIVF